MKSFNRILTMGLMLLMGVVSVACSDSENVDEAVTKITLSVSPAEIVADGVSAAAFKVTTDLDTDVTGEAVITCTDGSAVSGAKFTTATAGTYTFKATYGNLTSNEVTVTATEAGNPDTPKENVWVTTDVKTPITYAEGNYYGDSMSVGIEVKVAEAGNLQFVCTPGEEIKSYRVQVFPMSWVYNLLINQMNTEGKTELTTDDAEAQLLTYMTLKDETYAAIAGRHFSGSDESLGSDFAAYEFDWFNMFAWGWHFQSDADYLIVTLASFDELCESEDSFAKMAVCHVHTTAVPVQGNPQVIIDVNPTYSNYSITYTANEDCVAMYYLSNMASEIDQYIEFYGDKMYRDFLRHYGAVVDLSEPYTMSTRSNEILDKTADFAATAIALDENGNPAEVINREDFRLKELPEDADHTLGGATITNIRTASSMVSFNVDMDSYCYCIYQAYYTKEQAEQIMNGDEQSKNSLREFLAREGWGHQNMNFKFDSDIACPVGDGYIDNDGYWLDLEPETSYAIIYVTRNGLGDISPLQMSDVFTTKKRIDDQPELCDDIYFEFEMTAPSVQSNRWTMKFDPDKVARYYLYCYDPPRGHFYNEEGQYLGYYIDPETEKTYYAPTPQSDRGDWIYWVIDYRDDFGTPATMYANTTVGYQGGMDTYELAGFDPGTTFKYVCLFESWDGVISKTYFEECTTASLTYGENPALTYTVTPDEEGNYNFVFTGNGDTGVVHYTSGNPTSLESLQLSYLYEKRIYTKDDFIRFARNFCIESALTAKNNVADTDVSARELAGQNIYVALAIGEGAKDGNPVYSDLVYLVWTKELQKFVTIDEYFAE